MSGKPSQSPVISTPKPSCHGLWVRPGRAPEAKKARLGQETGRVAGVGREPGRLASLPTVSVLVVCPALPPALPSLCLSSEPCPLDPEQAGPGTHGPILSASCAQMPPTPLQLGVLALPGTAAALACPSPGTHRAPLLGGLGAGLGKASLPLVSGPCPPAAEALQAHNTVFQEHAAPSSPGSAPSTRGFRRASEISIASQVSGMAESYTASGIAQSECSSATHPSELRALSCCGWCQPGPLCPPEDS